jgi:heptosyltransferase-3
LNTIRPRDPRLDPLPNLIVRATARLASWLLPMRKPAPSADDLRRILIVRTDDRVGNALLTIPLARALSLALPNAEIDLLLPKSRLQVARGLPGFNLVEFDKRDSFRHPVKFLRFLKSLRARSYDAAIDAAHWHAFSLTSALLTRWSSRRLTVGSDRAPTSLYSAIVRLPGPAIREVEAKLQLASGLGLTPLATPRLETALGTSPASQAAAKAARESLGLHGPFAAFNPGARKPDHRWDTNQFAGLAKLLFDVHGLRALVLWGPGEEGIAREVCAQSGGAAICAPPTNLEELAAHLRASSLAVTNDTGPMHLAVACGAPTLAVFLAEDGARWGHLGPRFAAVDVSLTHARDRREPAPLADARAAAALASQLLALTGSARSASLPRQSSKEEVL